MQPKPPEQYELEEVELMLSVIFNGGRPWRNELSPDDDMPRGWKNPKNGSSFGACKIDITRAWDACFEHLRSPQSLYLKLGRGLEPQEIADHYGVPLSSVEESLYLDLGLLRDAASAGYRKATT